MEIARQNESRDFTATRVPNVAQATALAFGLAITVLVFVTSHLSGNLLYWELGCECLSSQPALCVPLVMHQSPAPIDTPGGQVNPAVTFGLVCSGALSLVQGLLNTVAQLVGGIFGAAFLRAVIPGSSSSTLGTNEVAPGVSQGNALCGELVMTFVLVLTVLETAVNKLSNAANNAPLAIGFAVYCAHAVLLPIDGCCINPARFLGPALVSGKAWYSNSWVFVVGPYLGALFAVPFHLLFRSSWGMSRAQREPFEGQETVPEIESQLHPRDMGKVRAL